MSSQKKKTDKSTSDKISYLPDEAIEKILTCLPLQEAVKTSILSSKWRFMWRQIPEINFDDSFCKKYMIEDEHDAILIIDQVLLLHTGSIPKFNLCLSCLESHNNVDRVIYSVLRRGIKDFCYTNISSKHGLYNVPSSLFLYEQLEQLSICGCFVILPTKFIELGKLVSLVLCHVSIYNEECSSLISSCPLLERLTINELAICDRLEIVAPKLKVFGCGGILSCIRFINTPHLESLSMTLQELSERKGPEPVVLYNSLPALQFLNLCGVSTSRSR